MTRFFTKGRGVGRKVIPVGRRPSTSASVKYKEAFRVSANKQYLTYIASDDTEMDYIGSIHDDMQFINQMRIIKSKIIKTIGLSEFDRWVNMYDEFNDESFEFYKYAKRHNVHMTVWQYLRSNNMERFAAVLRAKGFSQDTITDFIALCHENFWYDDLDGVRRGKFYHVSKLVHPAVRKYLGKGFVDLIDDEYEEHDISQARRLKLHKEFLKRYHDKYQFKKGYLEVTLDPHIGTQEKESSEEKDERSSDYL